MQLGKRSGSQSDYSIPAVLRYSRHDEDEDIEYVTDPELIDEKWGERVDLVIDGGIGNMEGSTVVDCTQGEAEIIRQGAGWLEEG